MPPIPNKHLVAGEALTTNLGGLGVASSNLAAPTNDFNELAKIVVR